MPVDVDDIETRSRLLRLPDDVVLTAAEVALAAGVQKQTVRRWTSEGRLIPHGRRNRQNIYRLGDVKRLLGLDQPNGDQPQDPA